MARRRAHWIPAFAGMTIILGFGEKILHPIALKSAPERGMAPSAATPTWEAAGSSSFQSAPKRGMAPSRHLDETTTTRKFQSAPKRGMAPSLRLRLRLFQSAPKRGMAPSDFKKGGDTNEAVSIRSQTRNGAKQNFGEYQKVEKFQSAPKRGMAPSLPSVSHGGDWKILGLFHRVADPLRPFVKRREGISGQRAE